MKQILKTIVATAIYISLAGILCSSLYWWTGLNHIFKVNLFFENWIGIICIAHIIFPSAINHRKKNDD